VAVVTGSRFMAKIGGRVSSPGEYAEGSDECD